MPSDEAKAAFAEGQQYAGRMRDIHAQEQALQSVLAKSGDAQTIRQLEAELGRLRQQWIEISRLYTSTVGRFSTAVDREAQKQRDSSFGKHGGF
jgi:hypothetical protein